MEKLYLRSLAPLLILLLLAVSMVWFKSENNSTITSEAIHWYPPEQAEEIATELGKPMFVYVFTKWCEDCPKMEQTTFREKNIVKYINENYVPVRLNADNFTKIDFIGHSLSVHEMTSKVLGVEVYPSVVWFETNQKPKPVALYIEPHAFKSYLKFYNFKLTDLHLPSVQETAQN